MCWLLANYTDRIFFRPPEESPNDEKLSSFNEWRKEQLQKQQKLKEWAEIHEARGQASSRSTDEVEETDADRESESSSDSDSEGSHGSESGSEESSFSDSSSDESSDDQKSETEWRKLLTNTRSLPSEHKDLRKRLTISLWLGTKDRWDSTKHCWLRRCCGRRDCSWGSFLSINEKERWCQYHRDIISPSQWILICLCVALTRRIILTWVTRKWYSIRSCEYVLRRIQEKSSSFLFDDSISTCSAPNERVAHHLFRGWNQSSAEQ